MGRKTQSVKQSTVSESTEVNSVHSLQLVKIIRRLHLFLVHSRTSERNGIVSFAALQYELFLLSLTHDLAYKTACHVEMKLFDGVQKRDSFTAYISCWQHFRATPDDL